jgi:hypothetical protein
LPIHIRCSRWALTTCNSCRHASRDPQVCGVAGSFLGTHASSERAPSNGHSAARAVQESTRGGMDGPQAPCRHAPAALASRSPRRSIGSVIQWSLEPRKQTSAAPHTADVRKGIAISRSSAIAAIRNFPAAVDQRAQRMSGPEKTLQALPTPMHRSQLGIDRTGKTCWTQAQRRRWRGGPAIF